MTGFSADWLTLREPYDKAARSAAVLQAASALMHERVSKRGASALRIVDLACGTGSTLRSVTEHLPVPQSWRLCDYDAALLTHVQAMRVPSSVSVEPMQVDLHRDLDRALSGDVDLVTTSALLDLVSQDWLEQLAHKLKERRLSFYAALSYDGHIALTPPHANDARLIVAVNQHQHGDKGFGPALGPDAAEAAVALFTKLGFDVVAERADWTGGAADADFQRALIDGWASAARETGALKNDEIDAWLAFRLAEVRAARATLRVGHIDFLARAVF